MEDFIKIIAFWWLSMMVTDSFLVLWLSFIIWKSLHFVQVREIHINNYILLAKLHTQFVCLRSFFTGISMRMIGNNLNKVGMWVMVSQLIDNIKLALKIISHSKVSTLTTSYLTKLEWSVWRIDTRRLISLTYFMLI